MGKKISALPNAGLPFTGAEMIPFVRAGATLEEALENIPSWSITYMPSLTDPRYGGACDGVTNDDAAWALLVADFNAGLIKSAFIPGWSVTTSDIPTLTRSSMGLYAPAGRRGGGILLTNNNSGLHFAAANPLTDQIYGITLSNFGIWCTKADPSGGIALRLSRVVQSHFDVDIRDVYRGVLIEGGGDSTFSNLNCCGSPTFSALSSGSYLLKMTFYPGTTEVPTEWWIEGANLKGAGAVGVNYLENAVILHCFDGLWMRGSHVGFSYNAGLNFVPQNNINLYMANFVGANMYVDGNSGGDPAAGGIVYNGSNTPFQGDLDFEGTIVKAWLGTGVLINSTKLTGFRMEAGASVQDNGRGAVSLTGLRNFNLALQTSRNNIAAGAYSCVKLSGCSKGEVAWEGATATSAHPIGLEVDATCADLRLSFSDDGSTVPLSIAAGATRIHFPSENNQIGGNPTCVAANPLVPPQGFRWVIVTGNTNFDTITYPGASHGMELTLIFSGAPTLSNTGNMDLGGLVNWVASRPAHFIYNGARWQAINIH